MQTIDLTIEEDHTQDFTNWLNKRPDLSINTNHENVGKIALFYNGYDVPMKAVITGIDESNGDIYLNWDCYWFPINPKTEKRKIKIF